MENEQCHYVDYSNFYPDIMRTNIFPYGHYSTLLDYEMEEQLTFDGTGFYFKDSKKYCHGIILCDLQAPEDVSFFCQLIDILTN